MNHVDVTGHDTGVGFLDEVVPGDGLDVARWRWWSHVEGALTHYYVQGPCPACGAPRQQGHGVDAPAPIEGQGRGPGVTPVERRDTFEVSVRCLCGHDHGREGATGCGRRWSLVINVVGGVL